MNIKKKEEFHVYSGHQPNFLPYLGFFYKMDKSDIFVLDDDVQFSKGEFCNYNYIVVNGKKHKVTVPVSYNYGELINKVRICYEGNWDKKFLKTIQMNYIRHPYYRAVMPLIKEAVDAHFEYLSDLNIMLISRISNLLGIKSEILLSSTDVPTKLTKNERNVYQGIKLCCDTYYSGIGGKEYNDLSLYKENWIKVVYSDYKPVIYPQLRVKDFIPNLSVLDYLFNCGFVLPWGDSNG